MRMDGRPEEENGMIKHIHRRPTCPKRVMLVAREADMQGMLQSSPRGHSKARMSEDERG